jgi:hypothetical protein
VVWISSAKEVEFGVAQLISFDTSLKLGTISGYKTSGLVDDVYSPLRTLPFTHKIALVANSIPTRTVPAERAMPGTVHLTVLLNIQQSNQVRMIKKLQYAYANNLAKFDKLFMKY